MTQICKHKKEALNCDICVKVEVHSLKDDSNYVKCPRCWVYHACKMNFEFCCDRCCTVLLQLSDEIVAPHFKEQIRESYRLQKQVFSKSDAV